MRPSASALLDGSGSKMARSNAVRACASLDSASPSARVEGRLLEKVSLSAALERRLPTSPSAPTPVRNAARTNSTSASRDLMESVFISVAKLGEREVVPLRDPNSTKLTTDLQKTLTPFLGFPRRTKPRAALGSRLHARHHRVIEQDPRTVTAWRATTSNPLRAMKGSAFKRACACTRGMSRCAANPRMWLMSCCPMPCRAWLPDTKK